MKDIKGENRWKQKQKGFHPTSLSYLMLVQSAEVSSHKFLQFFSASTFFLILTTLENKVFFFLQLQKNSV
jgi:hypothetical protein